jgi:selenocysteine lyase/cysteine desulfurase
MDWTTLRDDMPVTRQWAYFDHAAVAPLTGRAVQALAEWAGDMATNGDVHESQWVKRVDEVRRLAGRLLDADPLDIGFIKNTSEGIGIVAEGLPWRAGDNVVSAAEEYPANVYPWMNLASRGVELRQVASRGARLEIEELRAAMDDRTRLVSLSAVEYASGFRNNLDAIGALCRERGVYLCVDAIQALGALPISVRQTPIDFLAADGHKWLLGAEGAGLLYVRRELVERLHPVGIGWNSVVGARQFGRVDFTLKPHAGRWESGSLNVGGIMALGASLQMLLEIGIGAVAERIMEVTDYLCARAEEVGLQVFSSRRPGDRSGIVSLVAPASDVRALVRHCRTEGVVINQRAGRLRVSPHCYNTTAEVDRFLALLAGPA